MQSIPFESAVQAICERDSRIHIGAFNFLREALDKALEKARKEPHRTSSHVSAVELLDSVRDYALDTYGPMAITLLNEWGVNKTADFGWMVFQLIDQGMFGKQDSDCITDFDDIYDFHEAFAAPYLPSQTSAA